MLKLQKFYPVREIIKAVSEDLDFGDSFCLYGKMANRAIEDQAYWIDGYPDVTDDGEEIYPDEVSGQALDYIYSGQQFSDVVQNVLRSKKNPTMEDYLSAFDYYSKNDTFIDFP